MRQDTRTAGFIPALIRTVSWEVWTWERLGYEIRSKASPELSDAMRDGRWGEGAVPLGFGG